jgi:hypothetical protein
MHPYRAVSASVVWCAEWQFFALSLSAFYRPLSPHPLLSGANFGANTTPRAMFHRNTPRQEATWPMVRVSGSTEEPPSAVVLYSLDAVAQEVGSSSGHLLYVEWLGFRTVKRRVDRCRVKLPNPNIDGKLSEEFPGLSKSFRCRFTAR